MVTPVNVYTSNIIINFADMYLGIYVCVCPCITISEIGHELEDKFCVQGEGAWKEEREGEM